MVEIDPDCGEYFEFEDQTSTCPCNYHVVFFDEKVSRAWIPTSNLKPFHEMRSSNKKQCFYKGQNYYKAVSSAAAKAERALRLSIPERLSEFSFSKRYDGRWRKVECSDSEESLPGDGATRDPEPDEVEAMDQWGKSESSCQSDSKSDSDDSEALEKAEFVYVEKITEMHLNEKEKVAADLFSEGDGKSESSKHAEKMNKAEKPKPKETSGQGATPNSPSVNKEGKQKSATGDDVKSFENKRDVGVVSKVKNKAGKMSVGKSKSAVSNCKDGGMDPGKKTKDTKKKLQQRKKNVSETDPAAGDTQGKVEDEAETPSLEMYKGTDAVTPNQKDKPKKKRPADATTSEENPPKKKKMKPKTPKASASSALHTGTGSAVDGGSNRILTPVDPQGIKATKAVCEEMPGAVLKKEKKKRKNSDANPSEGAPETFTKSATVSKPNRKTKKVEGMEIPGECPPAKKKKKTLKTSVASCAPGTNDERDADGEGIEGAVLPVNSGDAPPKKKRKLVKLNVVETDTHVTSEAPPKTKKKPSKPEEVKTEKVSSKAGPEEKKSAESAVAKSVADGSAAVPKFAPKKKVIKPFKVKSKMDGNKPAVEGCSGKVLADTEVEMDEHRAASTDLRAQPGVQREKVKGATNEKTPRDAPQKKKKGKPFKLEAKAMQIKLAQVDPSPNLTLPQDAVETSPPTAVKTKQDNPPGGKGTEQSVKSKEGKPVKKKKSNAKTPAMKCQSAAESLDEKFSSSQASSTKSVMSWEEFKLAQEQVVPKDGSSPGENDSDFELELPVMSTDSAQGGAGKDGEKTAAEVRRAIEKELSEAYSSDSDCELGIVIEKYELTASSSGDFEVNPLELVE